MKKLALPLETVDTRAISIAVAALAAGELVAYPTETFYALGADAFSPAALARLFAVKRREPDKPVALIAANTEMAFRLFSSVPERALRLADAFWPGPLTLVITAAAGLSTELLGPDGGVGVRVSPHPVAHALSAALGRPITATSANLAGGKPAATAREARVVFDDKVKAYLEDIAHPSSASDLMLPSTVVKIAGESISILRPGAISGDRIAAAISREI